MRQQTCAACFPLSNAIVHSKSPPKDSKIALSSFLSTCKMAFYDENNPSPFRVSNCNCFLIALGHGGGGHGDLNSYLNKQPKNLRLTSSPLIRGQKGLTTNNHTNGTKECVKQFKVIPRKTRALRQIAPESSAKSLSHNFFVVPFLSLTKLYTPTTMSA